MKRKTRDLKRSKRGKKIVKETKGRRGNAGKKKGVGKEGHEHGKGKGSKRRNNEA